MIRSGLIAAAAILLVANAASAQQAPSDAEMLQLQLLMLQAERAYLSAALSRVAIDREIEKSTLIEWLKAAQAKAKEEGEDDAK